MTMTLPRRRHHVARLPLILVLLLAGQRQVVGGAGASSEATKARNAVHQTVVDASGEMESIDSLSTMKDVQVGDKCVLFYSSDGEITLEYRDHCTLCVYTCGSRVRWRGEYGLFSDLRSISSA